MTGPQREKASGKVDVNLAVDPGKVKQDAEKVSRCLIPIGGAKIAITGTALTLESLIATLGAAIEAAKKSQLERHSLRAFEAVLRDKAGVK